MSRVYTQINLKKIAKDYFDRGYTPEGIDHDMDPHCETMEELNEWAKKHGYMNYIFELNFVRIMSKKSQKKWRTCPAIQSCSKRNSQTMNE